VLRLKLERATYDVFSHGDVARMCTLEVSYRTAIEVGARIGRWGQLVLEDGALVHNLSIATTRPEGAHKEHPDEAGGGQVTAMILDAPAATP
jgi:hypothetical protein